MVYRGLSLRKFARILPNFVVVTKAIRATFLLNRNEGDFSEASLSLIRSRGGCDRVDEGCSGGRRLMMYCHVISTAGTGTLGLSLTVSITLILSRYSSIFNKGRCWQTILDFWRG